LRRHNLTVAASSLDRPFATFKDIFMKKFQLAVAAALTLGSAALPLTANAQAKPKHHKLATVAAGVAGYEVAKHSHNKFAKKHRFAAGIASAVIANKALKARDKRAAAAHGH
jgi:hypothetical protein